MTLIGSHSLTVMALLRESPRFASSLVHLSKGGVPRGSVYTTLQRLVDEGYVAFEVEVASPEMGLDRKLYSITNKGQKALNQYLDMIGLTYKD